MRSKYIEESFPEWDPFRANQILMANGDIYYVWKTKYHPRKKELIAILCLDTSEAAKSISERWVR